MESKYVLLQEFFSKNISALFIFLEVDPLGENGAQLTCGITGDVTQSYDFTKCGRMPDLKHEPELYVPLKRRGLYVVLCQSTQDSVNW